MPKIVKTGNNRDKVDTFLYLDGNAVENYIELKNQV